MGTRTRDLEDRFPAEQSVPQKLERLSQAAPQLHEIVVRELRRNIVSMTGSFASVRQVPEIAQRMTRQFLSVVRGEQTRAETDTQLNDWVRRGLGPEGAFAVMDALHALGLEIGSPALRPALDQYRQWFMLGYENARRAQILTEHEQMQRGMYAALERQIAREREARAGLQRRQEQLQVAAELTRVTAGQPELKTMLNGACRYLVDRLDLEFAGVFLTDEFGKWAVLRAGAGAAGAELVTKGYQFDLERSSPVTVALTQRQVLLLEGQDRSKQQFLDPLRPDSALNIVVPLVTRRHPLGALTLHSAQVDAFTQQDLSVLTIVGDELANLIENGQLLEQTNQNLQELRRAQHAYVRSAWTAPAIGESLVYSQSDDDFAADRAPGTEALPLGDASANVMHMPITLRGEVIGVVDLYDVTNQRTWSDDDQQLASSVIEQTALAAENARLFDQAQQRAQELEALNEITNIISQKLDLQQLLEQVHREVQRVMPADSFSVSLYNETTNQLSYPFVLKDGKHLDLPETTPAPGTTLSEVLHTGKSIILNGTTTESGQFETAVPLGTAPADAMHVPTSVLFAPLRLGDRVVGALSAQSVHPQAYGERERDLLEGIAGHVAVAVQNAQLFESVRQRARETEIVNEMARALSGVLEESLLFETVYQFVRQLVTTDAFLVWLYDDKTGLVTRPALYDLDEYYPETEPTRPPTATVAQVLATGESVVTNLTPQAWEQEKQRTETILGSNQPSASRVYVPLRSGNRLRGVLSVQSYRFNAYDEQQVALLNTVAHSVVATLENIRLFAETNKRLNDLAILHGSMQSLTQELDYQVLLSRIVQQFRNALDMDTSSILSWDGAAREMVVRFNYDPQEATRVTAGARDDLAKYPEFAGFLEAGTTRVIRAGDTDLSPELSADLEHSGIKTLVVLPLLVKNRVIAAIRLGDRRRARTLTEDEVRLGESLASQTSVVLENARLFDETQQALAETRTLYEISARLNAATSLQEALEAASGPAIVAGATSTSLFKVSADASGRLAQLEYVAAWPRDLAGELPFGPHLPAEYLSDPSVWEQAPNEPRLTEDVDNDPHLHDLTRAVLQAAGVKSSAILPLRLGEHWVGMLAMNWSRRHTFGSTEIRLYRAVMSQAATVLENRRLFGETQHALGQTQIALGQLEGAQKRLNLQYETATMLASAATFEDVATELLRATCNAFDWQMGEYWQMDGATNRLSLHHVWHEHDESLRRFAADIRRLTFAPSEGLVGRTWAEPIPIWVPDLDRNPGFRQSGAAQQAGLKSAVSFPLLSGERVFGVTTFFSTHAQPQDDLVLATMTGVGSQIGQFMERRLAEEAVRQQNTYLTALHETTLGLMRRLELEELLQNIITRAGELVGTEHGYVYLVEPDKQEMRMRVGIGAYQSFIGTRVHPGQGLAATVWQSAEPIVTDDYRRWSGRLPMVDRDVLRAVAGVPLKSNNEIVGVLGLASLKEEWHFAPAQVETLKRFAELAAVALDNAQLYDATRQALEKTQRIADREKASAQIADKLYAAPDLNTVLRTAAEELQRSTGSRRAVIRLRVGSPTRGRYVTDTTEGTNQPYSEPGSATT